MNERKQLKVDGCITFWTVAYHVNLADLIDGLTAVGFNKFAPQRRTAMAALRDAIDDMFPGTAYRVEALADRLAYEVVQITRGQERNSFDHHLRVKIDKDNQIECVPHNADTVDELVRGFNKHLEMVRAPQVTQSLLAIIGSLHGIAIKPGGHVYWLPGHMLDMWRQVGEGIEKARTGGTRNTVEMLQHEFDPRAVRAVRNGIIAEVTAAATRMHTEIMSATLGKRALESRQSEVADLRIKLNLYEELLDTGLTELRAQLTVADEAACAAALLLASGAALQTA